MNDMSQPPRGMTPIQANTPMSVTLEAQEWNVVCSALNELPMRISRPVYDKLIAQFQELQR